MPIEPQSVTAVMYHYVRDLENSAYPGIKGLTLAQFEGQLDYIADHYTVLDIKDLCLVVKEEGKISPNSCLLTFDDGFVDHYENVLPRLLKRGWTASFFPPALSVRERKVLDVHKIHFILASVPSRQIKADLLEMLDRNRDQFSFPDNDTLFAQYGKPNRFNDADTAFIKQLLQTVLQDELRRILVDELFAHYISEDEAQFAKRLYMSFENLRQLVALGMTVGGHGYEHLRLGCLGECMQDLEIDRTLQFLIEVYDRVPEDWAMCYPYGSYNDYTLKALASRDCRLALTTEVGMANLERPLELCRFDTKDFPLKRCS